MNHILQKGKEERKREKGKTELLFLDHNVLKCDLLFSLRFPSCPVSFLKFSFFSFLFLFAMKGLRQERKSYIHKPALSINSRNVFGLAEKKSYMNLGSGGQGMFCGESHCSVIRDLVYV